MDLVGSAASVGALATLALGSRLTLVKVFLHALLTDVCITRAISKGAARLICAITVLSTSLDTLNDRRAHISVATPREAFEAIVTVIICLFLAFVAN